MTGRVRSAMLAALSVAALGLAACGSDTPAAPGGGAATAGPTAGTPGKSGPAAPLSDACTLVSVTEAAAATGLTGLTKAESSAAFCSYQGGGGVDVSVTPAPFAQASVDSQKSTLDSPATDIAGLGDAAFVYLEQAGIGVGEIWAKGYTVEIRVQTTAKDPVAAAQSLSRTAVGHLPG